MIFLSIMLKSFFHSKRTLNSRSKTDLGFGDCFLKAETCLVADLWFTVFFRYLDLLDG